MIQHTSERPETVPDGRGSWVSRALATFGIVLVPCAFLAGVQYRQDTRLEGLEVRLNHALLAAPAGTKPRKSPIEKLETSVTIPLDGVPTKGKASAPVALVVYSDFWCPFCSTFARGTQKEIERTFVETGDLLLAFKQSPILSLHPRASATAEVALCAKEQDRFWPVHDRIFNNPSATATGSFESWGAGLGVNEAALKNCLASGRTKAQVAAQAAEADELGLTGTPSFLMGIISNGSVIATHRMSGARAFADFRKLIESGTVGRK